MKSINTVTGTTTAEQLGTTLMHEHLLIGWAGWELDCAAPKFERRAAFKNAVDRLKELKDLGLQSFVDPCPMDIGRDVNFMAEVSEASGVRIVCATGLYKEDLGNTAYFKQRSVDEIAEVYSSEITKGVGNSGIKAGIIKCATGKGQVTKYEENCLRAAARAHLRTGAPITTHTEDGTMGREQLDIFASEGVDLQRVIIGHSCGSADLGYHRDMLDRGCFLGFDRFGLDFLHPDKLRLAALIGLLGVGYEKQIVLSHDSVWCWLGRGLDLPPETAKLVENWKPTHVFQNIVPALKRAGVSEEKIRAMLVENPRRYFG
ncbi:MAG: phosphotriesterase-related protein [Deltaproteobacteria bacterium]|jgi:phosphotriesterase-related protein|nr:phosphotriesterase-related protein [Deltaproteobacteria bacterium]